MVAAVNMIVNIIDAGRISLSGDPHLPCLLHDTDIGFCAASHALQASVA